MRYLKSFADNNNLHLMESKIIKFSHRYRLLEQKVVKDFPKSGSDGEKIAIKQDNDKYWIYKWDENEKIKNWAFDKEVDQVEGSNSGDDEIDPSVSYDFNYKIRLKSTNELPTSGNKRGDSYIISRFDKDGKELPNCQLVTWNGNNWENRGLMTPDAFVELQNASKKEEGESGLKDKASDWFDEWFGRPIDGWMDATTDALNNDSFHFWMDIAAMGSEFFPGVWGKAMPVAIDGVHALQYLWLWKNKKRDGTSFWKTEEEETQLKWMFWITAACAVIPGAAAQLVGKELKQAIRYGTLAGELLLKAKMFIFQNIEGLLRYMDDLVPLVEKSKLTSWIMKPEYLEWAGKKVDDVAAELEQVLARRSRKAGDVAVEVPVPPNPDQPTGKTLDLIKSPNPIPQKSGVNFRKQVRQSLTAGRKAGKALDDIVTQNLRERMSKLPKNWVDADYLKPLVEGVSGKSQAILRTLGFKNGENYMLVLKDSAGNWIGEEIQLLKTNVKGLVGELIFDPIMRTAVKATEEVPGVLVKMMIGQEEKLVVMSYKDLVKYSFAEAIKFGSSISDRILRGAPKWLMKLLASAMFDDDKKEFDTDKLENPSDTTKVVTDAAQQVADTVQQKLAEQLPETQEPVRQEESKEKTEDSKPIVDKEELENTNEKDLAETEEGESLESDIEAQKAKKREEAVEKAREEAQKTQKNKIQKVSDLGSEEPKKKKKTETEEKPSSGRWWLNPKEMARQRKLGLNQQKEIETKSNQQTTKYTDQ